MGATSRKQSLLRARKHLNELPHLRLSNLSPFWVWFPQMWKRGSMTGLQQRSCSCTVHVPGRTECTAWLERRVVGANEASPLWKPRNVPTANTSPGRHSAPVWPTDTLAVSHSAHPWKSGLERPCPPLWTDCRVRRRIQMRWAEDGGALPTWPFLLFTCSDESGPCSLTRHQLPGLTPNRTSTINQNKLH